jgi:hypothetical protein
MPMTENEARLVKMLAEITHCLQTHIAEDAHKARCAPSDYCPCTDNEIATAVALLAEYNAKPTH